MSYWESRTEALSTSALGRNLQKDLDELRAEYAAVLLELSEARADIARVIRQRNAETALRADYHVELVNLRAEVEALRARLSMQTGLYHLTDKGRAALEPKE